MTACTGPSESENGPLEDQGGHGWGGIVVDVNQAFTDEFEVLIFDEPITLTSLELVDAPSEMQIIDVLLAGPERHQNGQVSYKFPPKVDGADELHPAFNTVLDPSEMGHQLLIGLRVTREGKWKRGGLKVHYESQGVKYVLTTIAELTVCTPKFVASDGSCPMEDID